MFPAVAMSEFKFACPVCGQHMMCDASQAGSVMDCPTCFQKIVAPQAPAPDSKFVLTGSKFVEKKINVPIPGAPTAVEPPKKFPAALVIALILGFMGVAAAAIYWATIIHPRRVAAAPPLTNAVPVAKAPEKPAPVAPPASDANWTLAPGTNAIADSPVAGRIHAQDFIVERASFSTNGTLTLRGGTTKQFEFGCAVNFGGAQAESLAGQTLNVMPDADQAAKITLRWKDASGAVQKENFTNGYAMRLEFGVLANNRLPGKIYLCLPDMEKSYLLGSFNADARKPRPKAPKK